MKITISVNDFREEFKRMGRGEQFSYEALGLLFDYLEEWEVNGCEELELDVIGLCCDFCENEPRSIAECYGVDNRGMSDEESHDAVVEYLIDQGCYIGTTEKGDILYRTF